MRRSLTTVIATAVLAAAVTPAAAAQSSDPGLEAVALSSQQTEAVDAALFATLDAAETLDLTQPRFPSQLTSSDPSAPAPAAQPITEAAIVDKQVEDAAARLERWTVASPSMGRDVEIQIIRAVDPAAPAPHVYLLGGAESPRVSHWVSEGWAPEVFAHEQATVIMPTQAYASFYSDWRADDPVLGRSRWETFLADELAPLLAAEPELNFNGGRALGGLSMGAIGAVHLANSRPDVYDAVIGISGCYSTMDTPGQLNTHVQVGLRGGDVANMWGPVGSEDWWRHDVVANPEGLRTMAVYLYAGNGVLGQRDRNYYAGTALHEAVAGSLQERGSMHCTLALDESMRAHGMTHQKVVIDSTGAHNWNVFGSQLRPAWEHVRPALY
ncbi:alpha/beta hydrolase [Corynebacterium guangdongense]|uniref:S-formylglutathione hydrolase FrmB n=1 Tax=Corynebacterium guangdongense TaxID=1783348 RepID=A0ABU1ZYL2_9CORY|nr:alpha/beta hydrolase family protein [Corynebacterium guangdongense]MDR7330016.1 S-formylglutathione hydrolase FrmB [Corynebacterium guangdongense]WJZ18574.1 Diacylglycerol acyltransferase/mycolyltransferase Ag85A precursor [Corynebacterium guangdongense]